MGSHRFALGVHIEGIGELGGSAADGTLFVSRKDPDYDGPWEVDLWSAMADIPDVLKDRADIWQSEYRTSAAEMGLVLDDDAQLPKALVPQSWRNNYATVISDDGSTIEVAPVGVISAGERLFCGTETIEFDSVSSSGADAETWNVTRGRHLTEEVPHFSGQYIYDRPADLVERPMRIVLIEGGEVSEVIWTGLIANWKTNGAHTQLNLKARALHQTFRGQELNGRAQPIDHTGDIVDPSTTNWTVSGLPSGFEPIYGDGARATTVYVEAGGRYFKANHTDNNNGKILPIEDAFEDAPTFEEDELSDDKPIWQVLVHGEQHSLYEDLGAGETGAGAPDLPYEHVMTMALCHLTSTGSGGNYIVDSSGRVYDTDIFNEDWGIGMPQRLLGVDAWVDVIRRYPSDTADAFVWGDGGQGVAVWQKIKAWARGYNYLIVPNSEGKLQPVKISDLEITDGQDIADQSTYLAEHDAPVDAEGEKGIVQVSADYAGLPFQEPSGESVKVAGRRRRTLLRDSEATLDLTWISKENEQKVRALLEDHADKRGEHPPQMPIVGMREHTDATGSTQGEFPPIGQWVQIRGGPERGLLGPAGDYIDPESDQLTFTGLVVERELNTKGYLVKAKVLLWMWGAETPARLVAPGAEVGVDTDTGDVVGSDTDGDWISYDGNPLIDFEGGIGLMAGDEVTLERPDGMGFDQVLEITQIDMPNNRIYVDQAPSPSGWVEEGHLVRPADEQVFANDTWSGADYWSDSDLQDRRYAYIVDATGTFASGEAADTYTGV
jgi:hypothetical protein